MRLIDADVLLAIAKAANESYQKSDAEELAKVISNHSYSIVQGLVNATPTVDIANLIEEIVVGVKQED